MIVICHEAKSARVPEIEASPARLIVDKRLVYPALAYTVPGMAVGEVGSVKVSPNLTYYERKQNPDLPPNVALRYEIELISISDQWDNTIYRANDEAS